MLRFESELAVARGIRTCLVAAAGQVLQANKELARSTLVSYRGAPCFGPFQECVARSLRMTRNKKCLGRN